MPFVNIEANEDYPVFHIQATDSSMWGIDISEAEYNWMEWVWLEYANMQVRLSELHDKQNEDAVYQARNYDR